MKLRKTISWPKGMLQRSLFPKLEDPKSGLCDNVHVEREDVEPRVNNRSPKKKNVLSDKLINLPRKR